MDHFFVPADPSFQLADHLWDGFSLILPCVSVGNVPQLTVDLLINTFVKNKFDVDADSATEKDLRLVGYIRSEYVHPFAGPDPFALQGPLLATSIQVFASTTKKLILIQQRSPIRKEFRNEFYSRFSEWISRHTFSLVLLLSSSFDHYLMPDLSQPNPFPIKYIGDVDESLKSFLETKLESKAVERVDPYTMKADPNGRIHLPGSGSARAYLKSFAASFKSSPETKLLCLIMFCSEGDNRQHAFKFADKVANLVNRSNIILNPKSAQKVGDKQSQYNWSTPFSWRTLFGAEAPNEIF